MKCSLCRDCGWVCEDHPGRPRDDPHACSCGGAGAPWYHVPVEGETPQMPDGFKTEIDKDGWRHQAEKGPAAARG